MATAFLLPIQSQIEDVAENHGKNSSKVFHHAGLVYHEQNSSQLWFNWKKKGTFLLYHHGHLVHANSGYLIRLSNGKEYATQTIDPHATFEKKETEFKLLGNVGPINNELPLLKWLIPFKLFTRWALRSKIASRWFNRALKMNKIHRTKPGPIDFARTFQWNENKLLIEDHLKMMDHRFTFLNVKPVQFTTTPHSPSSRFIQLQQIQSHRCIEPSKKLETPTECIYETTIELN